LLDPPSEACLKVCAGPLPTPTQSSRYQASACSVNAPIARIRFGAFRLGDALTTTPETLRLIIDVNLGHALDGRAIGA